MLDHGLKIANVRGLGLLASNTDPKETVQIIRQIAPNTIRVSLRNGETFEHAAKDDEDMRLTMMDLLGYMSYDIIFNLKIYSYKRDDDTDPALEYLEPSKSDLINFFNELITNQFEFEPLLESIVQDVKLTTSTKLISDEKLGFAFNFKVTCFLRNSHASELVPLLREELRDRDTFINNLDRSGIIAFDETRNFYLDHRITYQLP